MLPQGKLYLERVLVVLVGLWLKRYLRLETKSGGTWGFVFRAGSVSLAML